MRTIQPPRLTPAVKGLLIAIGVAFVLQLSLSQFAGFPVLQIFGFTPPEFLSGYIWQIVTYSFLHGGLMHILFNCLVLFMLGPDLESRWGTKRFLTYYAVCLAGSALFHTLIWVASLFLFPSYSGTLGLIPTVGASGALYGLFAAFGLLNGEAMIYVMFMFPMKAKHFTMLLAGITVISAVFYTSTGVAHLFHLGGLVTGYLYLKWRGPDLNGRGGRGLPFGRKRVMDRDEVRRRLNVITKDSPNKSKYPITWN